MDSRRLLTLVLASHLLVACAAMQPAHDTIAYYGRVEGREAKDGGGSLEYGIYRPGMGGAIGGAVASVIATRNQLPAYLLYYIRKPEGDLQAVQINSNVVYDVGQCIEVVVAKEHAEKQFWKYGEASIRPSTSCRT